MMGKVGIHKNNAVSSRVFNAVYVRSACKPTEHTAHSNSHVIHSIVK